ncbi:MAG: hypothetical protein PQJ59_10000 [Spirochaetales bacterium]|nr:hypothetical protein [Spirochaetales bacterium]
MNKKIEAELYRLGELPKDWEEKINKETIDDEVGEILASDKDILNRYKPSDMARIIEEKAGKEKSGSERIIRHPMAYVSAVAAVLVMALILPGLITKSNSYDPSDLIRYKGELETVLTLYRQKGAATEVLTEETPAVEGDLIQMAYSVSSEMPYGIVFSIDGRGIVTRHLAPEGEEASLLQPGGERLLDFAYELDDAPRFETFYLLVADVPFPVDPVIDLLSREARENGEVLNVPEIIKQSPADTGKIGKMLQYALTVPKED